MSKKSASTSKQVSLTDPIYKGSCITLDYETSVKNLCDELHNMFDYRTNSTVLKGIIGKQTYDASSYPNTKSAIEKLQKSLKQYEANKKENPFYLVMFSLKSLLDESKKDDGMFSKNPISPVIEEFVRRNDGHIIIHALEHADRTIKKLHSDNAALEVRLSAAMESRERVVRQHKNLEVSFAQLQNLTLDESQFDAEKGTFGHELVKLKKFVSKFRLIAITKLQLAQANIESELVIGFLSDVQFQLLKDIHHTRDTSLFLNDVLRNLTFGLSMLLNEVSDDKQGDSVTTLKIKALYDKITDLNNVQSIHTLFDQANAELNESGKERLRNVFERWNTFIDGVGKFTPKDLHTLCDTVTTAHQEALVSAKVDNKPVSLNFKDTNFGDRLMTIYKIVCNIKQVYSDHTFFDIEGRDELRGIRASSVDYFEQLRAFMANANVCMRKNSQKVEFSALEGYKPDYDEVFKEVYDQIWQEKLEKSLNKSVSVASAPAPDKLAIRETQMNRSVMMSKKSQAGRGTVVKVRRKKPPVAETPAQVSDENALGHAQTVDVHNADADQSLLGSPADKQPITSNHM